MTITNSSLRLVALVTGVAVALALMGAVAIAPAQAAGLTQTQIQSIVSLLASFGADQATINNVTAALNGQATPGNSGGSSNPNAGTCPALSRDIQQGSSGADVKSLQVFLNGAGFSVAASGAGSMGNETMTFGPATKAAVAKFQAAKGVSPAAGYVGAKTRAAIAATCGGSTGGSTGGTTGGAVSVSAGAQPVNSLAPAGAQRVPFTTFTLTNNSSAAVTINSVTVQRAGLAVDANFGGVVLLDSNGIQIGIAKTFNSNHQANVGDVGFVLPAGSSQTFTVAGNISSSGAQSGQVAALQVVAINTGATVSGSLPISGASQTINTTLTIGSVSTSTSSYDPGATQSKSIGDTNVRFSGIRFTANSAEDLKLYSIRWRQVGTASAADVSNVMTYVNGTAYPTTVDSSGKYYTSVFPGGVLVTKGNSIDVYIQGDITGSNAASRSLDFDIDKNTDVYFVGQLYGYGVNFTPSYSSQPWYNGYVTNVSGGSATVIQNASSVTSANIPVNVSNTVLGGFQTNFTGEPVTVSGLTFTIATSSGSVGTNAVTSVSLVDENGAVVAGPVDATNGGSWTTQTVSFTDTVTFPTGLHTWTIKGKVPSSATNGTTLYLTTTANSTNWVNATGQTTGNSISLPGTLVTMNSQTVKGATLTVNASTNPVAQSIVTGTGVMLANIQLDASQSGEDIRLNNLPLSFTGSGTSGLNTCQLYNGSTALNLNGSNVVNSVTNNNATAGSYSSGSATTFTFDNSLTVPKGTVVTLTLKCNIASGTTGTVAVGVYSGFTYSAVGLQSGNTLSSGLTINSGYSGTQSINSQGSYTATAASSAVAQPSLVVVPAGSTGVTIGYVKFRATNENVNLTKVGLTLSGGLYGSASTGSGASTNSGVNDVVQAYLYDGSTLVGTATFTGTSQTATSTLNNVVLLTKDIDKILTIKADLANIGVSSGGGIGDLVKVNPLNAEGSGVSSGQTIRISATSGVNGVQTTKSVPVVAAGSVTSCTNNNSCNGSSQILKTFTVTANAAGPISVEQLKIAFATSSASITNVFVKVLDGSNNVATSTFGTQQNPTFDTTGTLTFRGGPVLISAGSTYTFQVIADVAASGTTWSVTAKLNTDSAAIAGIGSSPTYIATTTAVANADSSNSNFIWSDNATTTAAAADVDWFNGYQVYSSSI